MDVELREAERQAAGAGPREQAAVLRRWVRIGELQQEQLRIAALLGSQAAALAVDMPEALATPESVRTVPGNWALAIHNHAQLGEIPLRHQLYTRVANALRIGPYPMIRCQCAEPVHAEVRDVRMLAAELSEQGTHGARCTEPFATTSTEFARIPGVAMTLPPGLFRIFLQAEVLGNSVIRIEQETEEGSIPMASQDFAFFARNERQGATIEHMGQLGVESVIHASIKATKPACESWRIMYEIDDDLDWEACWARLENVAAWVLEQ